MPSKTKKVKVKAKSKAKTKSEKTVYKRAKNGRVYKLVNVATQICFKS